MNKSLLELNIDIERAVRFLCEYLPESERGSRKPILAHNLRVGQDVYQRALENNYSNEGVIGAFLHDILEWSRANDTMLKKNFGKEVYRLVLANTKDRSIQDGGGAHHGTDTALCSRGKRSVYYKSCRYT